MHQTIDPSAQSQACNSLCMFHTKSNSYRNETNVQYECCLPFASIPNMLIYLIHHWARAHRRKERACKQRYDPRELGQDDRKKENIRYVYSTKHCLTQKTRERTPKAQSEITVVRLNTSSKVLYTKSSVPNMEYILYWRNFHSC